MNEKAFHVFTLGVRFGVKQSRLGLDIENQTTERLADILLEGFKEYQKEIEAYAKVQDTKSDIASWYVQHWTAKQSYRFGLLAGFDEAQTTRADKQGVKLLTEETIDKLTQLQFRSTNEIEVGAHEQPKRKPYIKIR